MIADGIPESAPLADWSCNPLVSAWEELDEPAKRSEAREMATYAAMLESQDQSIGRILDYLRETCELENTLIIYMSDSGPEGQGVEGPLSHALIADWVSAVSNQNPEAIGQGDVYAFSGTNWSVAQTGAYGWFKWFIGEGRVRVPMIVVPPRGTGFAMAGNSASEFASVKDISATIFEYAGVEAPGSSYKGRKITPASGVSLRGFLNGKVKTPRGEGEYYAFELFGNAYVVQGDYKAIKIRRGMWGDGKWHLYNILNDPGETTRLDKKFPGKLRAMTAYYDGFSKEKGLVPVVENWSSWFGFVDLDTIKSTKNC